MEPVPNATGKQKKQGGGKIKKKFRLLKTTNFTEIPKIFIYISIGSNWDMLLSNVQWRKISKPMGPTIIVII